MLLTQAEIEERIIQTVDALDDLVHEFSDVGRRAALAEADFKRKRSMMALALIERPPGGVKLDAKSRDARIELAALDEQETHLLAAAEVEAMRESMRAHRTRLDALRTLAANVRAVT